MLESQKFQMSTPTITNNDSFIEENLLNDNTRAINDALFKTKIEEEGDSGFSSNFDSPLHSSESSSSLHSLELNNSLHNFNERKIFVTQCRQELDNSKLPEDFDRWTIKKQYIHLMNNISKYFPNIPESLRYVLPAIFENGDCGRKTSEKPDWLIMDKFYRGQRFAQRYFAILSMSNLMGLIQIFSFADGLKPLILSQKSNTPYRAFKRYLRTIRTFRNWYTSDPWCEDTPAYLDIQRVRRLHHAMRSKLCRKNFEEIDQDSKIQNAWCPMLGTITRDFADACPTAKSLQCPFVMTRTRGLNQGEMSGTQVACMGLVVLYPEQFGIHDASNEDLEAFCHLWRGLGYLLGIEDQYNVCRGSLQEIRQRVEDMIEYWIKPNLHMVTPEWEHMTMCLYEGAGYISYFNNYKVFLFRLCDIYGLRMTRLYNSFSLQEKIIYKLLKFLLSYMVKLPGILSIMNTSFNTYLDRAVDFGYSKHAELKEKSSEKVSEFVPFFKLFDYNRSL